MPVMESLYLFSEHGASLPIILTQNHSERYGVEDNAMMISKCSAGDKETDLRCDKNSQHSCPTAPVHDSRYTHTHKHPQLKLRL